MLKTQYKLEDFSYELPQILIALYPSSERTDSRLFCLDKKTTAISHKKFKDILNFIM
jgi:S-adenosylmethionine:tRNA ribosyltransferase-isomerase